MYKKLRKSRYNRVIDVGPPQESMASHLPAWTRPKPHEYQGYNGPWIENYFYMLWLQSREIQENIDKSGLIYLPIFWTDIYVRGGRPKYLAGKLKSLIDEIIAPNRKYFTIVQHDLGTRIELPPNVAVFGAGGVGDIPIPLLKQPIRRTVRRKNIHLSFMGATTGPSDYNGTRSKMMDVVSGLDEFNHYEPSSYSDYCDIISRSRFTLCPRGFGATSFRLYESLALGSIPVYIWDEIRWLPYFDELKWDNIGINLAVQNIKRLPDLLQQIDSQQQRLINNYTSRIYPDYFTYPGVCHWILRKLSQIQDFPSSGFRT